MLPLAVLGMSFAEIAEETGMGTSTVQYWIDQLTEKGYVVDRAIAISTIFGNSKDSEETGKRRKRSGRSSMLTRKGAAYMIAIDAAIQEGTPIAVPD